MIWNSTSHPPPAYLISNDLKIWSQNKTLLRVFWSDLKIWSQNKTLLRVFWNDLKFWSQNKTLLRVFKVDLKWLKAPTPFPLYLISNVLKFDLKIKRYFELIKWFFVNFFPEMHPFSSLTARCVSFLAWVVSLEVRESRQLTGWWFRGLVQLWRLTLVFWPTTSCPRWGGAGTDIMQQTVALVSHNG